MFLQLGGWNLLGTMALSLLLSSCAIQNYPGQPGVRTNGFAKIDMETVDESGLWVYEVSYDNTETGTGVEQVVTKLYPGALTYTSNVRTNSDGSLYRHKFPYKGASIQMIWLPKSNTVVMPPDSQVVIVVDYDKSLDEIDDRNLSEENIFNVPQLGLQMLEGAQARWNMLKAGKFQDGKLLYSVAKIKLGTELLDLSSEPIRLSTTLTQTGVMLSINTLQKTKLRSFINSNFPKGFHGLAELGLENGTVFKIPLGINTIDTLKTSGKKVVIQEINSSIQSVQ